MDLGHRDREKEASAQPPSQDRSGTLATMWTISQVGWQVAFCILVGLGIDRYFDVAPWGILSCAMIGLVTSVYLLIRTALYTLQRHRDNSSANS